MEDDQDLSKGGGREKREGSGEKEEERNRQILKGGGMGRFASSLWKMGKIVKL